MADTAGSTRRTVIAAAGAAGLTAALVACGDSDDGSKKSSSGKDNGGQEGGSKDLGSAADIPEGGGKIFKDQKVVVTQPKKGEFMAFSAVCTHAGCTVGSVSGGTINCPCHGSKFHITDGSVAHGPAAKPLPKANVQVEGGTLKLT
jgi:nitrite reductase/ring-hydroxylating ferredoxin subunit